MKEILVRFGEKIANNPGKKTSAATHDSRKNKKEMKVLVL